MARNSTRRIPESLNSMDELRGEIDKLDRDLVALIAERARFIDRAIVLKARDGLPAYIPERVDEVVANACRTARELGAPEQIVETIWRVMVDQFIAVESGHLAGSAPALHAPRG